MDRKEYIKEAKLRYQLNIQNGMNQTDAMIEAMQFTDRMYRANLWRSTPPESNDTAVNPDALDEIRKIIDED